MNILIINHYAGSMEMGMEYRPFYFGKKWIKSGHNVTILAADNSHIRKHNPQIKNDFEEKVVNGVKYIWIKTPKYSGNSLRRVYNIFTFVLKGLFNAKFLANKIKPDVVIASSTYTIDNYLARKIAKYTNAKYFYEVHDLWPLSPIELGGMSKYNPFILVMQCCENYAYKYAASVISMLPNTQDHMKAHGLDLSKWHYIPNGFVFDDWQNPKLLNKNTLNKIKEIKQKYDMLVTYTGTLGLANALNFLVLAAEQIQKEKVAVVIVGDGPEKENLKNLVADKNLYNVFILDSIPKTEIPAFLELFDVLYISFQYQPLFRFGISPNKLFDYMMAEKPIIFSIKAGNDLVADAKAGLSIEPENADATANAIIELKNSSVEKLEQMGKNGKEYVLKHHDYNILSKRFLDIMLEQTRV